MLSQRRYTRPHNEIDVCNLIAFAHERTDSARHGIIRVRLTNRYDANSSSSAFASFRSRVLNPSVNQA